MLTGYNLTTLNEEYWEVYLRRHGEYNNKVNLACVFEKDGVQKTPIAGIASKMYQIEINDDLKPMNQVEISEDGDKITDSQSLYQAFIDAGGDSDSVSQRCSEAERVILLEYEKWKAGRPIGFFMCLF